jgi:hypothetical protein
VILIFAWAVAIGGGQHHAIGKVSGRSLLFLVLSGVATGISWLAYFRALPLGPASRVAPVDKLSLALTLVLAALFFAGDDHVEGRARRGVHDRGRPAHNRRLSAGAAAADAVRAEASRLRFSSRFAVQLALCRHPILPVTPVTTAASFKLLVGPFGDVFDGYLMQPFSG